MKGPRFWRRRRRGDAPSPAVPDAAWLRAHLAPWTSAWNLAGLEERLEIRFSSRFRSSLGRCSPGSGEIRLAAFLLGGPPELLREVLCHEAAHAAVYALHGPGPRPHGAEWRGLMRAAGFEPRARLPADLAAEVLPPRRRRRRAISLLVLSLLLVWASPGDVRAEAARGPVEVSVLTYNTRGLRAFFSRDDPRERFATIGRLVNAYDIALLQEDFAYHAPLAAHARHPIQRRGNPQNRNPLVDLLAPIVCGDCGAGLSTLIGLDEEALLAEHREQYEDRNGWLGGGNDAWVSKGLLAIRLRLPNGAVVDVYNTHLEAGKKKQRHGDHAARAGQLAQLAAAIDAFSAERAVVVAGDFNWRIDRPGHALGDFVDAVGLREAGASVERGKWRPRTDYIFYRGGERVAIHVRDAGEAPEFVDGGGRRLSDHPAIYARLAVSAIP